MKIRLLKSLAHIGLQRETVVEARVSPMNDGFYQIISGRACGLEVPKQHAVVVPDERLYTESELNGLHQELIQRREEIATLMEENRLLQEQVEQKKVVLLREVAEAITFLRDREYSNYGIITGAYYSVGMSGIWNGSDEAFKPVRELIRNDADQLLSALVNGYKIELTKEEELRQEVSSAIDGWKDESFEISDKMTDQIIEVVKQVYGEA